MHSESRRWVHVSPEGGSTGGGSTSGSGHCSREVGGSPRAGPGGGYPVRGTDPERLLPGFRALYGPRKRSSACSRASGRCTVPGRDPAPAPGLQGAVRSQEEIHRLLPGFRALYGPRKRSSACSRASGRCKVPGRDPAPAPGLQGAVRSQEEIQRLLPGFRALRDPRADRPRRLTVLLAVSPCEEEVLFLKTGMESLCAVL
ncbi:hypothetical protein NDU88_000131 [Pleurodeles waltl]|uniref:Uncharacterized protein n=1 Tax=Pleurodeles waltl TaxID=8319 RepID=A0AAV7R6Z1_PLEWA|nr:hypothetical protein NDU88_000131 [Pleurodeles waltl]